MCINYMHIKIQHIWLLIQPIVYLKKKWKKWFWLLSTMWCMFDTFITIWTWLRTKTGWNLCTARSKFFFKQSHNLHFGQLHCSVSEVFCLEFLRSDLLVTLNFALYSHTACNFDSHTVSSQKYFVLTWYKDCQIKIMV